ncbi:MAG: hypothetical protein OEY19_02755 [Gammaproteobacteria bacterium]|nr:hypothetical protein [Gammaproteobacteria bacterium]MDH5630088.1 hypothetical protein [Gammaproteobacteria bacterium]
MKKICMIILSIVLVGCASRVPLTRDTKIGNLYAANTILIIEETFYDGKDSLPRGTYFPESSYYEGYIRYRSPSGVQISDLIFSNVYQCVGGIAVSQKSPYTDYHMYAYNCQGDPGFTVTIPKKVKFRIINTQ